MNRYILECLKNPKLEYGTVFLFMEKKLPIQYFKEENTYTLSGKNFVLDIKNDISKIFFVEDSYNVHFEYLEFYFNKLLSKKDFFTFFFAFKYFLYFDYSSKNDNNSNILKLHSGLWFCECLFSENPCIIYDIHQLVKMSEKSENRNAFYNIFTHRYEIFYEKYILPVFDKSINAETIDYKEKIKNIYFYNLSGGNYTYPHECIEINLNSKVYKICKNLDVYVGEYKIPELSFLLKCGKGLQESCDIISKLKK
ncbi:hypothetical protein CWI38_0375p0020 [Hamiltosporidium tvaerminnensis]|uniref:Uncharacterized protein n=2 Tax=Hamiltosporidium TaxID=1176354 RepID=A0A4Q9L9P6_9MICR|nr:hypothetical protein CWI36_0759p0020 [Hamiltosporidium magnivora]TBU13634.1 hypothetical protein CWI38_0375p0020 [Hamiltosporidium tvaerminnensis]